MPTKFPKPSYALWLMPGGGVRQRLTRVICRLSREYSTPVFRPHVTLASTIVGPRREVLGRCRELASEVRALPLRLVRVEGREEFFRCVFARVKDSADLSAAHRLAQRIFGLRRQRRFLPHLSLVYGKLASGEKKKIAAALGKSCKLEFVARRVHVVAIQGPPSRWRRIGSFRLAE